MVEDNQAGVRLEPPGKVIGVDDPSAVEGCIVHREASVFPEMVERPEDRVVLQSRGDGMLALLEQAKYDQVEGIGGIIGEAQAVRVFAVKKARHPFSRLFDDGSCLQAEIVP